MNISKKALMSFLMALTSSIAMAQPYYHVMKQDGNKLTEEAGYDGQTYKVKIDMNKPEEKPEEKPEGAIGNKITIESSYCGARGRSFYFTNKGNVYYDASKGKFFFEESQLDYPKGSFNKNHCGHFIFGRTIKEIVDLDASIYRDWDEPTIKDFYFVNPENLPKLKEDLGNEEWSVLNSCEWNYVISYLGERWTMDGDFCFLIDTTPGKSLLRSIETKNGGKTLSKEDFADYEAQGLVCLPASGYRHRYTNRYIDEWGTLGKYWSCTPWYDAPDRIGYASMMDFGDYSTGSIPGHDRGNGGAVRLVILADD